jgi:integrase/recombinase XerD
MPKGIYARGPWWWTRFIVAGQEYREPLRVAVRGPKEERLAMERAAARRQEVVDQVRYGIAAPVAWAAAVLGWHEAAVANRLRPATIKRYLTSLGQLRAHLDPLDVQEIDAATVRKMVTARRRAGAGNATIRRDLTALSQVLQHAMNEGWRHDNPALAFNRKAVPERREPICLPLPREIVAVVTECPRRFGDLVEFAHETMMRQEEVASLQRDHIDRSRMVAMVYRAKARRPRAVPLTPHALAILDRQPPFLGAPWAFWHLAKDVQGNPCAARFSNIASNFGRYRRKAAQKAARRGEAFTGFRFHDLRHDGAVRYLRDGRGSIYDLQQVLGHSTIKTTELYLDYLTPDERDAAAHNQAQEQRSAAGKKDTSA